MIKKDKNDLLTVRLPLDLCVEVRNFCWDGGFSMGSWDIVHTIQSVGLEVALTL